MGEVRKVGNLAFLTKKGLFGGKMAFHREHKTSQKAQRLRLARVQTRVANLPTTTESRSRGKHDGRGQRQGDPNVFARVVRGCFSRSRRGLGETLKGWTRDPIVVDPGPL